MNPNTLIVVSGYAGDADQIATLMPAYEHHQCPVLVLSPEDSRIETMGNHWCLFGGKRCYIGQDSLDRQHVHLLLGLEQPFDWYLFNDSDSFCSSPRLPDYLYERDDTIWSNEVADYREPGYHDPLPHIAMQPPYFMSRRVLRELVLHGRQIADPVTPYIDWYMVQIAWAAGVRHQRYLNCTSYETKTPEGIAIVEDHVRHGANMIHSVKTKDAFDRIMAARPATDSRI